MYIETLKKNPISDVLDTNKLAIFMIKPCGRRMSIGGYSLEELTKGLIQSAGLEIVDESEKLLIPFEVRKIYPILDIPDPIFGETWKEEVISHLTSREVLSLLLEGNDAQPKAKIIKNYLRNTLILDNDFHHKIVKNIAHVADNQDFDTTYNVLFQK
ncbi:MAG: hypothetical protein WC784_01930 [Candidatus Shapirobacteria bacterium]|jgi:hypothetical protein